MYLMIDNYDSFVYNLRAYFEEAGHEILVVENDGITIGQIRQMKPEGIIISPGPKTPKDAGISAEVIRKFAGEIPILGVCLGHQTIGYVAGATVKKGTRPMHGKLSPLTHSGEGLFRGLPQDFLVTRYHSLVIDAAGVPGGCKDRRSGCDGDFSPHVSDLRRAVSSGGGADTVRSRTSGEFPLHLSAVAAGKNGGVLCIRSGKSENIRRSMFYFPDGKRKRTSFFWILLWKTGWDATPSSGRR